MPVDLKNPIPDQIKKPQDVVDALESIRAQVVDVKHPTAEQFERVGADIAALQKSAADAMQEAIAAKEMAKLGARTLGGDDLGSKFEREMRNFPRNKRNKPDADRASSWQSDSQRAFYDFLMMPPDELREVMSEDLVKVVDRARHLNDALVMYDAIMCGVYENNPSGLRAYQDAGGPKTCKRLWGAFEDIATPFARAMTTTGTATGLEWVPTGYTSTLIEDVRQPISVTGQFQAINMPQDPYRYPVQGRPVKSYLVSQGGAISTRDIATLKLTFTTVKHGALVVTSTELEEDSIVPLVGILRSELAFALNYGLADSLMNGQKTSTVDTASTPAATDVRASYDGLRYMANSLAAYTRVNSQGAIDADVLASVKGLLGRFGNRPDKAFWLTGFSAYAKLLTLRDRSGWAVVLTADKAFPGGSATFDTGILGRMFGSEIVVEQDYPENMDANGLITGAGNTLTGIHYISKDGFRLGIRRGILIEASREVYFASDQLAFRGTGRFDFEPTQAVSSVYKLAGSLVNIPTV